MREEETLMKKLFILVIGVVIVLSFSMVSCQKKEAPQKKETVTKPAPGYSEEKPAGGGYGEETPETGGYGGGY